MSAATRGRPSRLLPRLRLLSLLLPVALHATAAMARAQDPPVPDSIVVPPDTLAADTVPARELVSFPSMPAASHASFADGVWVWDRQALLRSAAVHLTDLLERVPAIAVLRAGVFAQPQAASAFGGTAAGVEIEIDGFPLDPLAAASFDLAQIPLVQLRQVRVERRLGLLRIRLLTEQPAENQPYTRVEAGIGEPAGTLFRGLFLVPHVIVGPLGLAIERLSTDGPGGAEPADVSSGWAKWAWTDGTRGVQLELLQATVGRGGVSPWPIDHTRRDVTIRARNAFGQAVVAEVYAAHSRVEATVPGTATEDEPDTEVQRESVQAGVRAAYESPLGVLTATVRYRDAAFLPRMETVLEADLGRGPLRVGAEWARASRRNAAATSYTSVRAVVGSFLGAAAFAEITRGSRVAPVFDDAAAIGTGAVERDGWRAGVSLDIGQRATGSIARVSLQPDRARPFGLPFDSAATSSPAGTVSGIEAHGRLIIVPDLLAIESWITDWSDPAGSVYLPVRTWRTALELHTLPLPSGNLEIVAYAEAAHRSAMRAYDPAPVDVPDGGSFRTMPPHTVFNGYLQIRVIDVRAFVRWDDVLGTDPEELPGRVLSGPRIFYGVKWNLWN